MANEKAMSEKTDTLFTIENIIDLIRTTRNKLIKEFLDDSRLHLYFKQKFNKELSAIKKEFLKRDLSALLISPVDLAHYGGLIQKLKTGNIQSIDKVNQTLFFVEIDALMEKYAV